MDDLIYLDNGATSYPKPQAVYDFMDRYYREYGVSPGRSGYDKALEAEEVVQGTREMLTQLFNGTDSERLTFSYNASDSLNQIIKGVVQKGDHVITTNLEHNSVLRPLYQLELDGVIEVTYIDFDASGYVNPDDFRGAIRENTRLVIMNHASNVIGTVQPVAEVGAICRQAGVLFAIDCSQSAGQVDIDVQAMNVDMLAFTGHKSLMGPTGIGGMYTAEGVEVKAIREGGTGVRSAVRTHLEEYPFRLECGTLNVVGVAGLYAGQKWLREEGLAKIHQQELALWDRLRLGLQKIEGVTTYCAESPENHIGILSFNVEGLEAGDVGTMLDVDHEIAVRTGLQCAPLVHVGIGTFDIHGTSRFGIGPFNTEAHIDTAVEAVREIASSR
ncbi:aminotransferase class V-fold PLP-dependent enzyme [Gemmatimonadota bacterium]